MIFLLALFLRLAAVFDLARLPTAHVLLVDADRYDRMALDLRAGGWLPPAAFDQAPGYPYFLAAVYSAAGHSYLAVRLLQALLDSLTVLLLAAVAARLFGRAAALATGALGALYGPLVFHTALVLKPTLAVFLTAAFLALWVLAQTARGRRRRWGAALGAGICLGASALLRENALVLIPVAMAAIVLVPLARPRGGETAAAGSRWMRRLPAAALLAAGAGLALLPTAAINHHRSGEWMLTSWQGGMNFLIGNARGASGTYSPLTRNTQHPTQERADAKALAASILSARRAERGLPAVEAEALSADQLSAVLWGEARRQIAEAPGEWLRLMGRKTLLFWNRYEVPDAEGFDLYRRHSLALRAAVAGFGLVGPLGLAGLVIGLRRRPGETVALGLLLAGICFSVVLFFVFARYRLPVVVVLLPLAGFAVSELVDAVRRRDLRTLAAAAAALAVAGVVAWLPLFSAGERQRHEAMLRYNLASAGLEHGKALLDRTIELRDPDDARQAVQTLGDAIAELDRVVAAMPDLTTGHLSRGVGHLRLGSVLTLGARPELAAAAYTKARRDLQRAQAMAREQASPDLERQAAELLAVVETNRERLP